jgi:hypothetical protein
MDDRPIEVRSPLINNVVNATESTNPPSELEE